jgi:hypothetical protein
MECKITLYLDLNSETILKGTTWSDQVPQIPNFSFAEQTIDDMLRTGLLYKDIDGSYHLTFVGEEILNQVSKA